MAAQAPPPVGRQDGEGGHVGLVDHEPDAGVGDDPLAGAHHEVVGHAVRFELAAEGVGRPRCRERGQSRWHARPGCPRARMRSTRSLTGGRATIPGPPGRAAHAARQGDVDGHQLGRSSSRRRPRGARAARASRAPARRGHGAARQPRTAASPSERVDPRPRPGPGARRAPPPGRPAARAPGPARPARGSGRGRRPAARPRRPAARRRVDGSPSQGIGGAHADQRQPPRRRPSSWRSASPTRRPVKEPGPVPTAMADTSASVAARQPPAPRPPARAGTSHGGGGTSRRLLASGSMPRPTATTLVRVAVSMARQRPPRARPAGAAGRRVAHRAASCQARAAAM